MCSLKPNEQPVIIVENDDSRIAYDPPFDLVKNDHFSEGSQSATKTGGAQFTMSFNGSAIWYRSDTNFDHGQFRVTLDGSSVGTFSSITDHFVYSSWLWCQTVEPGQHTLTVSNVGNDKWLTVDYLAYTPWDPSTSSSTTASPETSSSSAQPTSSQLSQDASPKDYSGLPSGAYVGIALGSFALLLLAVLLTLMLRDRRKRRQASESAPSFQNEGKYAIIEAGSTQRQHSDASSYGGAAFTYRR